MGLRVERCRLAMLGVSMVMVGGMVWSGWGWRVGGLGWWVRMGWDGMGKLAFCFLSGKGGYGDSRRMEDDSFRMLELCALDGMKGKGNGKDTGGVFYTPKFFPFLLVLAGRYLPYLTLPSGIRSVEVCLSLCYSQNILTSLLLRLRAWAT